MLLSLLSFIVGFASLLLVFSVLLTRQKSGKLNIYFLLALGVVGIQHILIGLEVFELIDSFKNPFADNFTHQFFMLVFYCLLYSQ